MATTRCSPPILLAAFFALAATPIARGPAQAAPPSVEETGGAERATELGRELEALRAKVTALEQERASATASAELQRRIEALAREIERLRTGEAPPEARDGAHGLGPAAAKVYSVKQGVSIGGYGELLFEAPYEQRDDGSSSGRKNQIDFLRAVLYAGYKFDSRFLFNSEIEFEHASTGQDGEVSVEFAYLEYQSSPEFNVRAGLLLIPMGWLNELHEPPTYLGARRPLTERVLLPSTWRENGFGVFGESGKLAWRAYLVNGMDASGFSATGIRNGRQNGARALAEDFAVTGRLDFKPSLATTLGASLYTGKSGQDSGYDGTTTIYDLHAAWAGSGFDLRALYARAHIGDAGELNTMAGLEGSSGVASRLEGGYFQAGYDVLRHVAQTKMSLVPYLRWERVNTQAEMPDGWSASPANDKRIVTFGAAWKPHPQIVLKADYEDWHDEAETGVDQFNVQLGYIF